MNLTGEYLAAKNDREVAALMIGGPSTFATREPAVIAGEWLEAMREALA